MNQTTQASIEHSNRETGSYSKSPKKDVRPSNNDISEWIAKNDESGELPFSSHVQLTEIREIAR
jgi:hypothetical protein